LDENREHFVRIYKEFLRQPDHKAAPQTPLVSVIVPTFNRPEGLQRALDGLVRQDYPNVETIVVNDGGESVDEIVNRMPESSHVFCISHKRNRGAGAARNTGLLAARGELIAYLDDDSCYFPNHIATLVTLLQSDSTAIAAYTTALHKMVRKDREGDTVVESAIIEQPFDLQNLMIANYIPLTCLMHRRAVLEETKGFAETEEVLENWDFVLRLAVNGSFAFFPKVTAETTVRIDTPHRSDLSLRYISTYRAICRRFALWAVPETRQAQEKKIRSYTDRLRHTRATLTRGEAPPSPIVPVMEGSS
jgi:glycosyltransferase involved in cell wall biosynthesis